MRVSLGETTRRFRKRNLATGVSTSEARRQEAEYDQALQGMQSTGVQDTAKIQEEGAMNRIMAAQEFEEPLRDEEVEKARLANESGRFARGIEQDYGVAAVRAELGLPPIVSRANVFYPERSESNKLQPKYDISSVATPGTTAVDKTTPGGKAPGGFLQKWSRAWEGSSKTPVGKMMGLPAINWLTQKGIAGLEAAGKGTEKLNIIGEDLAARQRGIMRGIFDRAFTPVEDNPTLPEMITGAPPAAPHRQYRPPQKKIKKKKDFSYKGIGL